MRPRLMLLLVVLSVTLTRGVAAAPVAAPLAPATPPSSLSGESSVDDVLDALDARGRSLDAFSAKVTLTETDEATQLSSTRTGSITFQRKAGDDARMRITLDQRVEPKKIFAEKIEYLLDNGWLVDRDYQKRIEVRRQVVKPGAR